MTPASFKPEQQDKLEAFLQVMYEYRGHPFEPTGRQADVRNIKQTYQDDGGDFWVVEEGDAIVGSIALKMIDRANRIGEIKRYFVLPAFQGRGIGKMLMAYAIDAAMKKGLSKLRLDTMKSSTVARAVFERHGFYEIPQYNDNDLAEIFMEKKLAD